ncbi:similar to Sept9 [Actinidia rufa]|uniref:Similar to Sept9 n=1 Tax=Actinidia rufa TaxID=165716 RepID=A0A7J0FQR7_9ERIC|nr:similar to Sept9 [Actinidia rufa]
MVTVNDFVCAGMQLGCSIPVADDPDKVVIPKRWTPSKVVQHLSYFMEDEVGNNGSQSPPLFGGHQSWSQRDESFKLKSTMKVHCGFMRGGGAEMAPKDVKYAESCRFVVASGIFDGYDIPHQPSYISPRSQKLFCFLMVVDEISIDFLKENVTVREDNDGGQWVGIWRLILLKHPPYDEPRRNGKVPKILTHRLFPQAQYSIWIDGKMELIVDPLLILERYLWRGKHTFAIAQHKHHHSIYEEADANKRRKRYARPLIDLHMKIYRYEGMKPWSPNKKTASDVPEGAIIVREHTALNNLFSCLWFNEVNLFTPRDQLSFGYVVYRLGGLFKFFMFPNCEYNSIFVLHPHTREHSSKVEWVKSLDEFKGNNIGLKESRGGLGLWTPYPGNLDSVVLPPVARTSKAG